MLPFIVAHIRFPVPAATCDSGGRRFRPRERRARRTRTCRDSAPASSMRPPNCWNRCSTQNPEGGVPFEQVVVDCGFTVDQIRGHKGD